MGIKQLVAEHTAILHKLAYEKTTILARLATLDNEMVHYTGVINAFEHIISLGVEDGNVHNQHNGEAGCTSSEATGQDQLGESAGEPTATDGATTCQPDICG